MNQMLKTISLIAVLAGASLVAKAQTNVWVDDFNTATLFSGTDPGNTNGVYGAVAWNFSGAGYGNPAVVLTNDLPDLLPGSTDTNNVAFLFDTDPSHYPNALNFGLRINWIPASGNTNPSLRAYTLKFDVAVQGTDIGSIGGYVAGQLGLFGNYGNIYYQDGCLTNIPNSFWPAAGSGYQHVEMPLQNFTDAHGTLLPPTDSPLTFWIGFYMAGHSYAGIEEIDIANVQLEMSNPPPPPPPAMNLLPAKPGLRVFAQDSTHPYNQEGFGTQDPNQSWVGVATPNNPVTYAITMQDFDTVNGYTLFVQFAQNASGGDPFGVYNAQNVLVWSITSSGPGGMFTSAINWKTNAPAAGENNNALSLTTTSSNGRGTWTLTFTNDTNGTVTAPDGTSGFFSLDPTVTPDFANPMVIDFGSCPNWNTAGYGQWITYGKIAITNVIDGNEYDDFTQDESFNTSLWNPRFSYNNNPAPYCVIQVPPGTNYWVNWTQPSDGFGLETKASLKGGTNAWFSPNYYGNSIVTNTPPTVMGGAINWTLIPMGCLPTVDGTPGGNPSPTAFFRLSNPGPSQ